ncbi:hypothetical protein N431DRAFT_17895 [Stipitochalara longipes BDJ]|nr:hypothetical protein N431DRAFT_17895 [Stipitochalara longipes BDJ]
MANTRCNLSACDFATFGDLPWVRCLRSELPRGLAGIHLRTLNARQVSTSRTVHPIQTSEACHRSYARSRKVSANDNYFLAICTASGKSGVCVLTGALLLIVQALSLVGQDATMQQL